MSDPRLLAPTRRLLVQAGAASLGVAALGPWPAEAARLTSPFRDIGPRHLWVRQVRRAEAVHARFRTDDGAPIPEGHARLSWLWRDWRDANSERLIDIRLFDVLARMQTIISTRAGRPIEIVLNSGYRTPRRNATIEGAAVNSQHIHGRAADITATQFPVRALAAIAEAAGGHGIGTYPSFLHVDVGPKGRRW